MGGSDRGWGFPHRTNRYVLNPLEPDHKMKFFYVYTFIGEICAIFRSPVIRRAEKSLETSRNQLKWSVFLLSFFDVSELHTKIEA